MEESITFGVTPWLAPNMMQVWVNQIESTFDVERCFRFDYRSDNSFLAFARQGAEGAYDIMEVPPHIASYLAKQHGWQIIAREAHEGHAIIIALASSNITDLQQLQGKAFGAPDPLAVVSVLSLQLFSQQSPEIVTENRSYRHHNDVVEALMRNEIVAGVIFSPILSAYQQYAKDQLVIVHTIPTRIDGYVVVSPVLEKAKVANIRKALIASDRKQEKIWAPWLTVTDEEVAALHKAMAFSVDHLQSALEE